jgi:hypothetical protein
MEGEKEDAFDVLNNAIGVLQKTNFQDPEITAVGRFIFLKYRGIFITLQINKRSMS